MISTPIRVNDSEEASKNAKCCGRSSIGTNFLAAGLIRKKPRDTSTCDLICKVALVLWNQQRRCTILRLALQDFYNTHCDQTRYPMTVVASLSAVPQSCRTPLQRRISYMLTTSSSCPVVVWVPHTHRQTLQTALLQAVAVEVRACEEHGPTRRCRTDMHSEREIYVCTASQAGPQCVFDE